MGTVLVSVARAPSAKEASSRRPRRRRVPEEGVLYRVLAEHLETFLDRAGERLPGFVARELRKYLHCGILAGGFARVHCSACGRDELVAFSCKGRAFCPSCGGRRMTDLAAQLCDRVLPDVPVRQWVLSFPWKIRFLLAYDPELQKQVRRIFISTVLRWLERRARRRGVVPAKGGAVVLVQRFGSALNLNLHFHALVLDGVYHIASPLAKPVFHPAPPLRDTDVLAMTRTLHDRILRALRRGGHLADEGEEPPDEPDELLLAMISAAAVQGRVALGPEAGAPIPRFKVEPRARSTFVAGQLCADMAGFSLHAKVRIAHDRRDQLERLCRYVARPALATERLSLLPDGRVAHRLRRPWRDGTTHFVFDPLTFIERLAALVPRPRRPLLTYHGVLAPAASWRDDIVPAERGSALAACSHSEHEPPPRRWRPWAELMKRAFEVDVLVCNHCGGPRKLIALLTDPAVIQRILGHLGLPLEFPTVSPARAPPETSLPF